MHNSSLKIWYHGLFKGFQGLKIALVFNGVQCSPGPLGTLHDILLTKTDQLDIFLTSDGSSAGTNHSPQHTALWQCNHYSGAQANLLRTASGQWESWDPGSCHLLGPVWPLDPACSVLVLLSTPAWTSWLEWCEPLQGKSCLCQYTTELQAKEAV